MSELEDGKACKDLWDFSVERGRIDTEKHPIGVLGEGLRSYIAALEAKLEAMERVRELLDEFQQEAQTRWKDYAPEQVNSWLIRIKTAVQKEQEDE